MNEQVFTTEATSIVYGPGAAEEIGFHLARLGVTRALLITDPHVAALGIPHRVRESAAQHAVAADVFPEARVEPNEASTKQAIAAAREGGYDGIVGVGGGSSIDTAKIAALFATHGGELLDYVNEPIGRAKPVPGPLLPLLAVPTTAGTGSEATSVAIIDFEELGSKSGISHRYLRPLVGIADPLLLRDLPQPVAASAGLDVVCHAAESYTARAYTARTKVSPDRRPPYQGSNPIADIWAVRALEIGGTYLRRAVNDPGDEEARGQMMLAATIAGIGFGNAGVHIPHACAYPIASLRHAWTPPGYPSGRAFVPHGFSVTVTAPACFELTQEAAPDRHRRAAELISRGETDSLSDAFRALMGDVGAPLTIGELGYSDGDVEALVDGALKQQRLLVGAPLDVTAHHLQGIFRASL